MQEDIITLCKDYPQLLVFLSLAIGYFVGKLRFFGFNLGSTAGVLLAALVIGQVDVKIPSLLKDVSFALFIFTIGYKVGPQFFGSLKKEGVKYIILSFFFAIVGLATAIILGKVFAFDRGTITGILGGALTQSSVIGTADGAINHLAISASEKSTLQSDVAVSYAITYIFGTAGLVVFFKLLPRLMGINLREEAKKLEESMSLGDSESERPELFSWSKRLELRTYLVKKEAFIGRTVSALEASFSERIDIDRIKRGDSILKTEPDTIVQKDDIVVLLGPCGNFHNVEEMIGPEVEDKRAKSLVGEILDICILNKEVVGKTLGELNKEHGHGIFLKRITRQGHELPLTRDTEIHKCDVLRVAGAEDDVERIVQYLGYPERATSTTDLVMVGVGCIIGTLVGLLAFKIGDIPITLGVGGGVLVLGLICGWLRSLHPTFGQIPSGAQWIFIDLGLNLFIACVGLVAGPRAVHALSTSGASIFFAGVILTLLPHILSAFFGRFVLKINPVLLFGAMTGAGTVTAALNALKDETDSSIPALGYTVPYAFGNVLLTIWGTVLVNVM